LWLRFVAVHCAGASTVYSMVNGDGLINGERFEGCVNADDGHF